MQKYFIAVCMFFSSQASDQGIIQELQKIELQIQSLEKAIKLPFIREKKKISLEKDLQGIRIMKATILQMLYH